MLKNVLDISSIFRTRPLREITEASLLRHSLLTNLVGWFFSSKGDEFEAETDVEVAENYCEVTRQASDHAYRFGDSERMWALTSSYEYALKKRRFDPVKVWREVSYAHSEDRTVNLANCRLDARRSPTTSAGT